ncbi:hypothetical protein [Caulobacter sp. 17J80-11]|uniref:hypothetical protein n=1 Tax=Caulobacter sp. 17J80-11 TaxID=2763502 RepID=UPI0016535825|nr:hypothetical protein [Caulobacter sp. 17J80-11]MBC6982134.1 hypothetical protein [Caulobacter sp. 17J80-11]
MTASRYRAAFCETAVECLSKGYSLAVLAGELDVARSTVSAWIAAHPAFAEAVARGRAKGAKVWEDRLAAAASGKGAGNATVIAFALKQIARDDWGERAESAPAGPGVAVTVEFVRPGHADRSDP